VLAFSDDNIEAMLNGAERMQTDMHATHREEGDRRRVVGQLIEHLLHLLGLRRERERVREELQTANENELLLK
jgi:hypothetical protein